jgi:hypothetical protein|tara:strand:- start:2278 stop:2460 length:183 start_codon:yes stop_codon:yes gene_type:complete
MQSKITKAPLMLKGINESFNKKDKELVSEIIWEYVRDQLPDTPGITGISYQINVEVQEEE